MNEKSDLLELTDADALIIEGTRARQLHKIGNPYPEGSAHSIWYLTGWYVEHRRIVSNDTPWPEPHDVSL